MSADCAQSMDRNAKCRTTRDSAMRAPIHHCMTSQHDYVPLMPSESFISRGFFPSLICHMLLTSADEMRPVEKDCPIALLRLSEGKVSSQEDWI